MFGCVELAGPELAGVEDGASGPYLGQVNAGEGAVPILRRTKICTS